MVEVYGPYLETNHSKPIHQKLQVLLVHEWPRGKPQDFLVLVLLMFGSALEHIKYYEVFVSGLLYGES